MKNEHIKEVLRFHGPPIIVNTLKLGRNVHSNWQALKHACMLLASPSNGPSDSLSLTYVCHP